MSKAKKNIRNGIIYALVFSIAIVAFLLVLPDFTAKASTVNLTAWPSYSEGFAANTTYNITLADDQSFVYVSYSTSDWASVKLADVPSTTTVNLDLNGHTLKYVSSVNDDWDAILMDFANPGNMLNAYSKFINNNGTLSITNSQTGGGIYVNVCNYGIACKGEKTMKQRVCGIWNGSGATLNLGENVTVSSYHTLEVNSATGSGWSTKGCSDMYMYSFGIYNQGTVNCNGATINAGAMGGGAATGAVGVYSDAVACGIYGGTVNINGGTITVDTKIGARTNAGGKATGENGGIAFGIATPTSATVMGNTTINVTSGTYAHGDSTSCTNKRYSLAVGVAYKGENYPTIGAGVNMSANCNELSGQQNFYGFESTETGFSVTSEQPDSLKKCAVLVGGYTNFTSCITGDQTTSTTISGESWFGSSSHDNLTPSSSAYYSEQSIKSGTNTICDLATECASNVTDYKKATTDSGQYSTNYNVTMNCGAPGAANSQYVILYRYYDSNDNIVSIDYNPYYNGTKVSNVGVVGTSDGTAITNNGVDCTGASLSYFSGGESVKTNYYKFVNVSAYSLSVSQYGERSISEPTDWSETGTTVASVTSNVATKTNSISPSTNKVMVFYYNYKIQSPMAVRIAVAPGGESVAATSTTNAVTMNYTGKSAIPGTDFNLAVISLGADKIAKSNSVNDDYLITEVSASTELDKAGNAKCSPGYKVVGTESDRALTLSYRYTKDGVSYSSGLPKDAGTYTVEVTVPDDTSMSVANSGNRKGGTFTFTLIINQATATIGGANNTYNATYGDKYGKIIPTSDFTVSGVNNEIPTGTISFVSVNSETTPNVTTGSTVKLVWTPDDSWSASYGAVEFSVNLVVTKRDVTVMPGTANATYGDGDVSYTTDAITFGGEGIAEIDEAKVAGWLNGTTFKYRKDSSSSMLDYTCGTTEAGTYQLCIYSFGGSDNSNYNFTIDNDTDPGKLTVEKKNIYFDMTAKSREYNESKNVDVTFTYTSGLLSTDGFNITYNTKANQSDESYTYLKGVAVVESADAETGKYVSVDTSKVSATGNHSSSYNLVVNNNGTCKVNITKSTPVVSNVGSFDITYDKSKDIQTAVPAINILATVKNSYAGGEVDGSWSWKSEGAIPTVDVTTYTAVYTPTDLNNFNTVEYDVTVNVAKAVVTVSVPTQNITYGDPIPALVSKLAYTGWTGDDTYTSIKADGGLSGDVKVNTTYVQGASVGSYPITVTSTLASTNYKFVVTSDNMNIVVGKKALTVTAKDQSIVYGTAIPTFGIDDVTVDGLYASDTVDKLGGMLAVTTTYTNDSNAGEYPIKCSGWTSNNYAITFVNGTLNVEKAVLTVTPNEENITYGAAVPAFESTYTGFVGNDESVDDIDGFTGSVVYSTNYSKGSGAGVTYTVTSDVTGLSSTNYTFSSDSNVINVSKARPSVTTVPTATITYTETLGKAVFEGAVVVNPNDSTKTVNGKFAYNDSTKVPAFGSSGNKYTCTFTPNDTANYEECTVSVKLTINEKDISGLPVIKGANMAGQELTVVADSLSPNDIALFDIQWIRNGYDMADQTAETYKVTTSDIGYTLQVKVTAKSGTGYKGTATSVATSKIIKSLNVLSTDQLDIVISERVTYDNNEHGAEVTVNDNYAGYVGEITVYYNGSTDAPVNAGTYNVTVDVDAPSLKSGDSEYNSNYYGPVSGLPVGTIVIDKADFTVTFEGVDKVYDGKTTATVTNLETTGKVSGTNVTLKAGTYVFSQSDVGSDLTVKAVDMTLTGTDKDNYNLIINTSKADIAPATLYAKAVATSRAYNGTTDVDVVLSGFSGYVPGENDAYVYYTDCKGTMNTANAGTNTVSDITYTAEGVSKDNYTLVITNENNISVIITKANPEFIAPVISGRYYDSSVTLGQISLASYTNSIGYFEFVNKSEVPTVDKTKYEARFVSTDSNYDNADCEITMQLLKTNVILKVKDQSIVYGSETPAFTIVGTGFTGGDTLDTDGVVSGIYQTTTNYAQGSGVSADGYDVNIDISKLSSPNYTFTTTAGKLYVTVRTINVKVTADSKVYDGNTDVKVNFSITDGIYGNDDVKLEYATATGIAKSANAGARAVTYSAPSLEGGKAANYVAVCSPVSGALKVTIEKAEPTGVIFPDGATMTFGNTLSTAEFTSEGSGEGTFAFVNADSKPETTGIIQYSVEFTPMDSNYKVVSKEIPVTVNVAKISIVVGVAGSSYEGSTLTPVITGASKDAENYMTFTWYRETNGKCYVVGNEKTYTTTEEDRDCLIYVMVSFDSTSPYQFTGDTETQKLTQDGSEGVVGCTTSTIQEKFMTFWERLLAWWRSIIEIITGISFGV